MNNQPRVQKKNKKSKLSGFSLFVIEFNKRTVTDGENTNIKHVEISRAHPHWDALSKDQKEMYKTRAKQMGVKIINTYDRFNSLGEKLNEVEAKRRKVEEDKLIRTHEIQEMIKTAADLSELDDTLFYFISTLSFFDDNKEICPAEFAIAKFSLREGVIDSMSIRINPGELPKGSSLEAMEMKAIHKYPLPSEVGSEDGEHNYVEILSKIVDFLHPMDDIPIFFTEGNDINEMKKLTDTQRIMKLIFENAGEYQIADELKIYSIDELLYYLREKTVEIRTEQNDDFTEAPFASVNDANDKFKKINTEYSYSTKGCDYHEEMDALSNCCLSRVRRYGYVIAKWCSYSLKYPLKAGHHFPESCQVLD